MNDLGLLPVHGFSQFGKGKKPAAPDAPVVERQIEIVEAGRQRRRDLLARRGFLSTLVAGNPDSQSGGKSLLGGGQ